MDAEMIEGCLLLNDVCLDRDVISVIISDLNFSLQTKISKSEQKHHRIFLQRNEEEDDEEVQSKPTWVQEMFAARPSITILNPFNILNRSYHYW